MTAPRDEIEEQLQKRLGGYFDMRHVDLHRECASLAHENAALRRLIARSLTIWQREWPNDSYMWCANDKDRRQLIAAARGERVE